MTRKISNLAGKRLRFSSKDPRKSDSLFSFVKFLDIISHRKRGVLYGKQKPHGTVLIKAFIYWDYLAGMPNFLLQVIAKGIAVNIFYGAENLRHADYDRLRGKT